ncbi:MAG TPA: hypothetical protein VLX30_14695 [Burkholderiales bacterium]|nr:hypothetical protein [Burkholderiales bacterium]
MIRSKAMLSAAVLVALSACTTLPTGPSVMAMPGSGKSFDQFRADDAVCRQFALEQSGGTTANQASVNSGVESAAVGTAVGAAAGALVGGHEGAGSGAAAGLLVGALSGAGAGQASGYALQRRYDNAYVQCMYAKGNAVPVAGQRVRARPYQQQLTPPPPPPPGSMAPPPPPSGSVPPPPPPDSPPPAMR